MDIQRLNMDRIRGGLVILAFTIMIAILGESCNTIIKEEGSFELKEITGDTNVWKIHPEMNPNTWLPPIKSYPEDLISIVEGDTLEYCNAVDGRLNGKYVCYFHNGDIKIIGNYINGLPDGVFRRYWNNGNIREKIEFNKGVIDGVHYLKYENNKMKIYSHYKAGDLDYLKYLDIDGTVMQTFMGVGVHGEIASKREFYLNENINFSAGLGYTGVKNAKFGYHIILNDNDTLSSIISNNMSESFNIQIDSLGRHKLKILVEEYESDLNQVGESKVEFYVRIIKNK